jgi:hypothetical protein
VFEPQHVVTCDALIAQAPFMPTVSAIAGPPAAGEEPEEEEAEVEPEEEVEPEDDAEDEEPEEPTPEEPAPDEDVAPDDEWVASSPLEEPGAEKGGLPQATALAIAPSTTRVLT